MLVGLRFALQSRRPARPDDVIAQDEEQLPRLRVLHFDDGCECDVDPLTAPADASVSSCDARSHVVSELPIGGSTDVMLSE